MPKLATLLSGAILLAVAVAPVAFVAAVSRQSDASTTSVTIGLDLRHTPVIPRDVQVETHERGWLALPRLCRTKLSFPAGGSEAFQQDVALVYDRKAVVLAGEAEPMDICFDVLQFNGTTEAPIHVLGRLARPMAKMHSLKDRQTVELTGHCQVVLSDLAIDTVSYYYSTRTPKAMPEVSAGGLLTTGGSPSEFEAAGVVMTGGKYNAEAKQIYMTAADASAFLRACHDSTLNLRLNQPLPALKSLYREFYLPQWGNMVRVDETYDLENAAVPLGPTYQPSDVHKAMGRLIGTLRNHEVSLQGSPVLFTVNAWLPAGTRNFEYYDEIGNISTSYPWKLADGSYRIELEPRHPVFGGWTNKWALRYHAPTELYQQEIGDKVQATIPWAPAVEHLWTDAQTIHVILPPLSTVTKIDLFGADRNTMVYHGSAHKWFDMFTSRPTVTVIRGPTALLEHGATNPVFQLEYTQKRLLSRCLHLLWWPTAAGLLLLVFQASALGPHILKVAKSIVATKQTATQELPKTEALSALGDYFRGQKDFARMTSSVRSVKIGGAVEDWQQLTKKMAGNDETVAQAERRVIEAAVRRRE